jgi:hypothetical protein
MKNLFKDILDISGVIGVVLLASDGNVLFSKYHSNASDRLNEMNGSAFLRAFKQIQEVEMIFENHRIYARKADQSFFFILMERMAPVSMIRLNCNILLPSLVERMNKPKGLGRFFKRK